MFGKLPVMLQRCSVYRMRFDLRAVFGKGEREQRRGKNRSDLGALFDGGEENRRGREKGKRRSDLGAVCLVRSF